MVAVQVSFAPAVELAVMVLTGFAQTPEAGEVIVAVDDGAGVELVGAGALEDGAGEAVTVWVTVDVAVAVWFRTATEHCQV